MGHDAGEPAEAVSSVNQTEIHEITASYSGPLPHPSLLAQYGHVKPDFPERIMAMAEKEQAHRHRVTECMVEEETRAIRRGQNHMLVIGLTALAVSALIAIFGHAAAAVVVAIGGMVSTIGSALFQAWRKEDSTPDSSPENRK